MLTLIWIFLAANILCVLGTNLVHVPCDDKIVEKLSRLAVTYINEDRQTGYKFALNRITNVQAYQQGLAGKVYYLDLDVLETKCHVLSPKSWKKCAIRPFMETQISGNCNTTVLHTPEGFSYLHSYDCTLVPDPPEKLRLTCPDCPVLLPVDSHEAIATARTSLLKYNIQSTLPVSLTVNTITRASHQSSPVSASFVEYTVQECSPAAFPEVQCGPGHGGTAPVGFCVGEVLGPAHGQQDVKVSCEIFHPQVVTPTQQEEKSTTLSKTPTTHNIPHISEPTFQDVGAETPRLVEPVYQAIPAGRAPDAALPASSSESTESAESSEELSGSVRAVKPPLNFRYAARRQRRQIPTSTTPPARSPVFLSVFPSVPSPFRSCPGISRYTTV
ncbi:fetuin-B [Rhinichthys klamathensis goyatoka]|uniref:fetuin-B n=1 Tax=Rhinichthys klamathensis goyatoka TaxID=3034132 RepID=UPI0024B5F253|nr:fetuin-B [Rhinichthys klamathensis goyatoka]